MSRIEHARADLLTALALLTRLPVRARFDRTSRAARAWPLVGLVAGGLAALVASLAILAGLAPPLAAGLALASQIVVTGALHEDGLADCADGLWGGHDTARRLEIMRDSRIGAYGVIALVLVLGLRWGALATLLAAGPVWAPLLAAAIASRMAMLGVSALLPHARGDGLSVRTGRPGGPTLAQGMVAGAVALALCAFDAAVPVLVCGAVVALAWAALARAKIGGQTGDVLGATQQLTETALLILLSALPA